jgi:poly-gamma-glutamate capsule biosynthesis protein CapA/YwtB (metallophosphatase superfamily)
MTGRGIDQILLYPGDPKLYEAFAKSAIDYVHLAEKAHGPVPRRVAPDYVWGAALEEFDRFRPDLRVVNLETAITRSDDHLPKGINYRMNPKNGALLSAAGIDCCILANNHVLDWGHAGLIETLESLEALGVAAAGAGRDTDEAGRPAILESDGGSRVIVHAFACVSSGAPRNWAAREELPGVNLLSDLSETEAQRICQRISLHRRPSDIAIVSVHWGPNWGYHIPEAQCHFARRLIDSGEVSAVFGHSSHHAKAIEAYRDGIIFYGCGDFLNDYEGIGGYESYRGDLSLMYFVDIEPEDGKVTGLKIVPLQIRRMQLVRPSRPDFEWLWRTLDRESRQFSMRIERDGEGTLAVSWPTGRGGIREQQKG